MATTIVRPDEKLEKRSLKFELREETDGPVLVGYPAVFDSPSEDMGFVEFVRRGAFKSSLAAGPDVRLLVNHEGLPLARTISGTLALGEDDVGLKMSARLDANDPDVAAILPKIRRGDVTQMSFGFYTIRDEWDYSTDPVTRSLLEVDIFDVAIVTFAAYPATSVDVRALQRIDQRRANKMKLQALLRE